MLEIGRDFSFIGEEFRVQVGNSDFFIDLLFYHSGLSCLVAFELKTTSFKPEYIGKMNFYLEALDKDHKKTMKPPTSGLYCTLTKMIRWSNMRYRGIFHLFLSPSIPQNFRTKNFCKTNFVNLLNHILIEFILFFLQ